MTSCAVNFGQKHGYAEIVVKTKVLGIEVNAIYVIFLVKCSFTKSFHKKCRLSRTIKLLVRIFFLKIGKIEAFYFPDFSVFFIFKKHSTYERKIVDE